MHDSPPSEHDAPADRLAAVLASGGAGSKHLREALGSLAVDIQHVGGTAVHGLSAKPILDIAIGVRRFGQGLQCREPLEALGYEYAYWAGVDNSYVFGKGVERTHLVHVVEYGGEAWTNYIRFRDALRRDPELRRAYEALKTELARLYAENRGAYTEAKGEFIRAALNGCHPRTHPTARFRPSIRHPPVARRCQRPRSNLALSEDMLHRLEQEEGPRGHPYGQLNMPPDVAEEDDESGLTWMSNRTAARSFS